MGRQGVAKVVDGIEIVVTVIVVVVAVSIVVIGVGRRCGSYMGDANQPGQNDDRNE
jgi:hypothetical protein